MFRVEEEEEDYLLSSYAFALPEERIAQRPCAARGESLLYLLDRRSPENDGLDHFRRLPELLPPRSLLVANNARVVPARLEGRRAGGGKLEFLLLSPPPLLEAEAEAEAGGRRAAEAKALIRPAGRLRLGESYSLAGEMRMTPLEKAEFGQARVRLSWPGSLADQLHRHGRLPLPPYIRRAPDPEDLERYQTIHADAGKAGAVAAPTAGLHFTPEIRESLARAGHGWAELTLYVGYGTFSPVRAADIRKHSLHPEYAELPAETVRRVLAAKAEGRPVVAVGTTSVRVLEGMAEEAALTGADALLRPGKAWLNCFIYPGRPLRVADALITNFHLPESTLIMLASAFTGRKRLLEAYAKAIALGCRFFSYGDAMLIR
ncbi:MAG: tRNA preQ1(34) S-adenosylmethionine ribosyltransferase-isomerase QueA [Desulfovibrionaceae bacterium]|nr:tRNA preQ1(34) S-adenosylmethionine ribosyltransferase-isomerase QueA [Desulfovibrionaceae bacterium]